jgi:hypothetical protein
MQVQGTRYKVPDPEVTWWLNVSTRYSQSSSGDHRTLNGWHKAAICMRKGNGSKGADMFDGRVSPVESYWSVLTQHSMVL